MENEIKQEEQKREYWANKYPESLDNLIDFLRTAKPIFGIGPNQGILVNVRPPIAARDNEEVGVGRFIDWPSYAMPSRIEQGKEYIIPANLSDERKTAMDYAGLIARFGNLFYKGFLTEGYTRLFKPAKALTDLEQETLTSDTKIQEVLANGLLHESKLDKIAGTEKGNVFSRDAYFRDMSNNKLGELLRMVNVADVLGRSINSYDYHESEGNTFRNLFNTFSEDLLKRTFNYVLRRCANSGSQRSDGICSLLGANPEYANFVDPAHLQYTLPYLIERDNEMWGNLEFKEQISKLVEKYSNLPKEVK